MEEVLVVNFSFNVFVMHTQTYFCMFVPSHYKLDIANGSCLNLDGPLQQEG